MAFAAFGSDPGLAQSPAPAISGSVSGLRTFSDCEQVGFVNQLETATVVRLDKGNDGDVDASFPLGPNSAGTDFNEVHFYRDASTENDRLSATADGRTGKLVANFAPCDSGTTAGPTQFDAVDHDTVDQFTGRGTCGATPGSPNSYTVLNGNPLSQQVQLRIFEGSTAHDVSVSTANPYSDTVAPGTDVRVFANDGEADNLLLTYEFAKICRVGTTTDDTGSNNCPLIPGAVSQQ